MSGRPATGSGIVILLALGGDPREESLLAAIERSPGRFRIARRCLDLADLLTAADGGAARVAVVSAGLARLDGAAVARLNASGLDVVAVVGRSDDAEAARMRALGIRRHALVDETPETGTAIDSGVTLLAALGEAVNGAAETAAETVYEQGKASATAPVDSSADPPELGGQLVAVWGPIGSPGRTTVATTLADELARMQIETLLVDADTYGPSVSQVLGILDEASGLAAAAREANAGLLDTDVLAGCARLLRPGLRVLTGVTRPDRWPELPASALAAVWRVARELAVWTVVDCGFCLERDEEIAYDTFAPLRNGATLVALAAADVVIAVGGADPIGLQRLIRGLPELRERAPQADIRVVVNQVRRGPVGRNPARRVLESLERHASVTSAVLVPADRTGLDAALASGRALAEVADASPARAAIAALAAELRDR